MRIREAVTEWPAVTGRALLVRQTWTLEFFLAVQAFVWGLWLLSPWSSFGAIPNAYTVLGLIPESIWGLLFTGHGIAHLIVLWHQRPDLCRRAALILASLWSAVFVSLLLTVPLATSTPIYAMNVLGCAWVFAHLDLRYHGRRI